MGNGPGGLIKSGGTKLVDENGADFNAQNPLSVHLPPLISTVNSTNTPLLAGITFTGAAERCNGYGIIYVNSYSDQASATDGVRIEQSSDGVNWDHDDEYTIPADKGKNYSINPHAKWYRVVYTNGAVDQTVFRLQTILKNNGLDSSHRIQDAISTDDDARLVKAVGTGEGPDNVFRNFKSDLDGNQNINDRSSGLNIAQGNVTGQTFIHKYGSAGDIDTADGFVDVWDGMSLSIAGPKIPIRTQSTTNDIDRIVSSAIADTQDIEIIGQIADGTESTQTVTLTGRTPVALNPPLLEGYRMSNEGSTNLAGSVYLFVDSSVTLGVPDDSTKVRAIINPGAPNEEHNQTLMTNYTIPAGKTGYMRDWYAATSTKLSAFSIVGLKAKLPGGVWKIKHLTALNSDGTSYIQHKYEEPEVFPEMTSLKMIADSSVNSNGVSAGFDIVLVDN